MHLKTSLLLAATAAAVLVTGCGDGRPRRVPVSGQVTIDGKPLTTGYIRLVPANARPAGGRIDSEGRFTLTTFEPSDGAVIGEHKVTVIAIESKNNGTVMRFNAPAKYVDAATSDVTVTIQEPTEGLPIELTWEGSGKTGPYEERSVVDGDADPAAAVE